MNVLTRALTPFVEAEPDVKQKDTRVFVFAPLACKEIHLCPALRLAANPMMTVPTMKNVTSKAESAFPSVPLPTFVPRGLVVRQTITKRHAPATILCKEMATHLAFLVRTPYILLKQSPMDLKQINLFFSL